ncbi:N-acetyltransferase [Echinococcus granulosus]|uniref:N-alpha-acetyltransferase 60 n=2 Tax=Echinococcus granulosus TaxID=6210 RepID=W6UBT1_ECHGR|nr:N-acetyltransferase [Echinococcus granulosus]EUB58848.1 N-acetyltransferase [Echinococcus granulosus]
MRLQFSFVEVRILEPHCDVLPAFSEVGRLCPRLDAGVDVEIGRFVEVASRELSNCRGLCSSGRQDLFNDVMSDVVSAVELRLARPSDIGAIQRLCIECFPVRYPDLWYSEVVCTGRYLTLLACLPLANYRQFEILRGEEENIVGLIVAEYRALSSCKVADRTIIHPRLAADSVVMYILSLAVTSRYRKCGIGSLLLSVILNHAKRQRHFSSCAAAVNSTLQYQPLLESDDPMSSALQLSPHQVMFVRWLWQQHRTYLPCRAVYLHTECTNRVALCFYRHRGFSLHHLVPRCYLIEGRVADGICCVFYCNGGYPQRSFTQECLHWLRQHFCATRTATVTLIGQVALRLKGAISALFGPCFSHQSSFFKVSRILPWQHSPSPSPAPDTTTTTTTSFLTHSL